MAQLVASQSMRHHYEVGWDRAISEVFAEDYAYTNLHRTCKIDWLERPSRGRPSRRSCADLGLAAPPVITDARPATQARRDRPRGHARVRTSRVTVDFGLLGPNRQCPASRASSSVQARTRGRVEVDCGTRHAAAASLTGTTPTVVRSS